MTQDNTTDDPLVGASRSSASDGDTAVDTNLTLAELNQVLGKDFKDVPTALKSVKDTFGYVGKKREDIENEVRSKLVAQPAPQSSDNSVLSKIQSLEEQLFYSSNPQYKGLEAVIKKMGTNPAEVVNSEEFKSIFEKVQVAEQVEKTRSVAPSNARLAQTKTFNDEAVAVANARGSTVEDVAMVAARSFNKSMQGQS